MASPNGSAIHELLQPEVEGRSGTCGLISRIDRMHSCERGRFSSVAIILSDATCRLAEI